MDPRNNPYSPGAGTPPPELAGRDSIIESGSIALSRIHKGLSSRSLILYGLQGGPSHGDVAFTVPLFDGFMKRIMDLETN